MLRPTAGARECAWCPRPRPGSEAADSRCCRSTSLVLGWTTDPPPRPISLLQGWPGYKSRQKSSTGLEKSPPKSANPKWHQIIPHPVCQSPFTQLSIVTAWGAEGRPWLAGRTQNKSKVIALFSVLLEILVHSLIESVSSPFPTSRGHLHDCRAEPQTWHQPLLVYQPWVSSSPHSSDFSFPLMSPGRHNKHTRT